MKTFEHVCKILNIEVAIIPHRVVANCLQYIENFSNWLTESGHDVDEETQALLFLETTNCLDNADLSPEFYELQDALEMHSDANEAWEDVDDLITTLKVVSLYKLDK